MAAPVSTKCPHCDKVLKLKTSAMLGKKVACPKCSQPFVIKRYEEPDEVEVVEDEYNYDYDSESYEDYGDAEEEEEVERPVTRSSKRSTKKKKKSSGGAWVMPLLIGLVAVCGLAGVVGGGIYLVGKIGNSNVLDFTYLPAETEAIVYVRPNEIWNAPLLAGVRDNPLVKQAMEQQQQTGLKVSHEDMDTIVVGFTGVGDKHFVRPFGGGLGPLAQRANPKFVAVARMKKDVDDSISYQVPGVATEGYNGQTIHVMRTPSSAVGTWIATPRILVFGEFEEVKKAIDRGATQPRLKQFDFVNVRHQLVFAAAPPNPIAENVTAGPTPPDKLQAAIRNHTKAASFGLTVSSDVAIEALVNCFDSSGADTLKASLDEAVADLKTKITSAPPQAASMPFVQTFIDVGKETLNSVQASKSGSRVTINARVPGKIADAVKQVAENPLAAMMMGGAMGGMNANQPPPFVPPQSLGTQPSLGGPPGQFPAPPTQVPSAQTRLIFQAENVADPNAKANEVLAQANLGAGTYKVIFDAAAKHVIIEVPPETATEPLKQQFIAAGFTFLTEIK